MNLSAKYVTAIVVAHLLVNIAHGLAPRELRVGLDPQASIFVIVVVLVSPLLAMALVWTTKKRIGLILLSLSMFGSLLFCCVCGVRRLHTARTPTSCSRRPSCMENSHDSAV